MTGRILGTLLRARRRHRLHDRLRRAFSVHQLGDGVAADPPTGHADEVYNTDTGDVGIESLTTQPRTSSRRTRRPSASSATTHPLNGTLTFKLYKGACVPSNLLDTLTSPVSGNNTYGVESASSLSALVAANANVAPGTAGTYNWQVAYAGDTHHNADIVGGCGDEHFGVANG